ncbi:MAG: T9SS type A sorting domain-containing protein [Bacteroidetes bacterium]|nr:T9SS type A sorting domain-containing protein [Bacteroidota bacterium]
MIQRLLLILLTGVLIASPSSAQDIPLLKYTLLPEEYAESEVRPASRVNLRTELPLVLYSVKYQASGTPEETARSFFRDRGSELGMTTGGDDMVLHAVRTTPGGTRVRFIQYHKGIPVYRSDVAIVLDREGAVRYVTNGYKPNVNVDVAVSKMGSGEAEAIAQRFLETNQVQRAESQLMIYAPNGPGRLVHQIDMVTHHGAWDILVDAVSGDVFRSEPTTHLRDPHATHAPDEVSPTTQPIMEVPVNVRRLDGSGWVFDPDPMTTSGARYDESEGFSDNNNADSPELTAQLRERTLRDLTFDGTNFFLTGPWADMRDVESPQRGSLVQDSSNFHFTRSQPAFEAVNTYFHLDQSMRYINETLGFNLKPIYYDGGVRFDPHWGDDVVNAQYLGGDGRLRFGEGGVDAAEDADIILHELGHGLHDWVTDGNLSATHGLSEGSSDYWAASYSRGLGLLNETDVNWSRLGRWGLYPGFSGRTVDYAGNYPFDLTGAIHTDGQIWSSVMMAVWDELGKQTTDLLLLEALSMLGSGSNTEDAARAIVLADTLLNGAANADIVLEKMTERGFIFRAALAAVGRSGPPPRAVTFFNLSTFATGSATAWEWDYESDGTVDNTSSFASNTYTTPGFHSVTLTATGSGRTYSTTLTDYISVNSGVYVWEGIGDTSARSGRFIADMLEQAGVETHYSRTALIHPDLTGFDAVFLSFGPWSPQSPPAPLDQIPARTIQKYLESGGRVYLEGAKTLGLHQQNNRDLYALFGIASTDIGVSQQTPVSDLRGQDGSISAGRRFSASRQTATTFVDRYTPNTIGRPWFIETNHGTVGIQAWPTGGGRAVALSYTLADLVDGESSRANVLQDVVDFFGIQAIITDTEQIDLPETIKLSAIYPNPFSHNATFAFELPDAAHVRVELFNTLGQRAAVLMDGTTLSAGSHRGTLDGSHLPSGMYFISLQVDGHVERMPVVLVR